MPNRTILSFLTFAVLSLQCFFLIAPVATTTAKISDEARRLGWDEDIGYVSTREELLSKHRQDRAKYERKLARLQLELEQHDLGLVPLPNPDRVRQKIASYRRKIDRMQGDLSEHDVQQLLEQEDMYAEIVRHRRSLKTEL